MDVLFVILFLGLFVAFAIISYRKSHVREVDSDGSVRWRPLRNGEGGEMYAHSLLSRLGDEYTILDDVMLHNSYGTTQIDHIVFSRFGIFVIETKDYSGNVYGSQKSEYWTQYIGREKHQFYNPINQNNGHVKALKYVFRGLPPIPIIPIVVFVGSADLKLTLDDAIVVPGYRLRYVIESYQQAYIEQEAVGRYIEVLQRAMNQVTEEQKAMHVQNIRNKMFYRQVDVSFGYCPKCGCKLVRREGRNGRFWGCSSYPKCRFTAQYDPYNPDVPRID